jgi:hypothetical protein
MADSTSTTSYITEVTPDDHTPSENPFSDSAASSRRNTIQGSVSGASSAYQHAFTPGLRYFHSRRVPKVQGEPVQKFKKDPKEKWLWIIPLGGLLCGLAITGVLIYLTIADIASHNYCSVLDDDFSTGSLNDQIWTKEVEVGGFGYVFNCIVRQKGSLLINYFKK